jgi:hypothetical protein
MVLLLPALNSGEVPLLSNKVMFLIFDLPDTMPFNFPSAPLLKHLNDFHYYLVLDAVYFLIWLFGNVRISLTYTFLLFMMSVI